jgi:lipopolysaccharide heptosyltransferase II
LPTSPVPDIHRILLTRMKYIGDVVLTTPLIRAVRDHYPDAFIAYMTDQKAMTLLEGNPFVNELIGYDYSQPALLEQMRIAGKLRHMQFDVVVDLFSNPRSALLTYASGAPMRIGKSVKGRGSLYTHRIEDDGSLKSAIAFHYQYLRPLGIEPSQWRTEIFLSDEEKGVAREYLRQQGLDLTGPVVAIHPGATWPNKIWLKERFTELIDLLRSALGVDVVISPGPGDAALVKSIVEPCKTPVVVLSSPPLRQLAAILSQCAAFVSNDCGPMHIGVAVGTPTVGIFGPEPVEIWFPYPSVDGHTAMFTKLHCSPCRTTQCFRTGPEYLECMQRISASDVVSAVKRGISRRSR